MFLPRTPSLEVKCQIQLDTLATMLVPKAEDMPAIPECRESCAKTEDCDEETSVCYEGAFRKRNREITFLTSILNNSGVCASGCRVPYVPGGNVVEAPHHRRKRSGDVAFTGHPPVNSTIRIECKPGRLTATGGDRMKKLNCVLPPNGGAPKLCDETGVCEDSPVDGAELFYCSPGCLDTAKDCREGQVCATSAGCCRHVSLITLILMILIRNNSCS